MSSIDRLEGPLQRRVMPAGSASDDLVRFAFERSPWGQVILELDDPADPRSWRQVAANSAAGRITGVALAEHDGKRWGEAFPVWCSSGVLARVSGLEMRDGAVSYVCAKDDPLFEATEATGHILLLRPNKLIITVDPRGPEADGAIPGLTRIIHHDLQEPLRTTASYLDLLESTFAEALGERGTRWVRHAKRATTRMRGLISAMLEWSAVGPPRLPVAPIDPRPVVEQVLEDLASQISARHGDVVLGDLPAVRADRIQLRSALQNLISNALKFHRGTPRVEIEGTERPDSVVLEVRDDGIGIEQQHREQVFEMLRRLHSRDDYPGSGVGLAIVAKVMRAHGGRAWCQPRPGGGTTFFLSFPQPGGHCDGRGDAWTPPRT